MKKTMMLAMLLGIAVLTGCSHNLGSLAIGKKISVGSPEYGNITWVDGFWLFDCPRENSYWEIEIDENAGLTFDKANNTLKGVKRIRRFIGKQATGYLKDISKNNPDAVWEYLRGDAMTLKLSPENTQKKKDNPAVKHASKNE